MTCNTSLALSSIFALVYASVAACAMYARRGCAQSRGRRGLSLSFGTAVNPSLELLRLPQCYEIKIRS